MKKIIAATMALVMAASMTACGSTESSSSDTKYGAGVSDTSDSGQAAKTTTKVVTDVMGYGDHGIMTGGWAAVSGDTSLSANKKAKAAFEKATETLTGMEYEPVAVLGTQVVAGTNYCILCRGRATVPDAVPAVELVYIYEDLQGKAEVTGSKTLIGSEVLDGGWSANTGDFDLEKNADVKKAFVKATEAFTGSELEPVAYLGSQVVAGTNHLILCRSTAAVPGAEPEFSLAVVYADLNGGAEMGSIEEVVFGEYDGEEIAVEDETEEENHRIANPWAGYETVEAAAEAAGISFAAPEKLSSGDMYLIQAMKGTAEVFYGSDGQRTGFRKGKGTDDISGDYNTYSEMSMTDISGAEVTLSGNDGKIFGATWTDGTYSYAYYADNGTDIETAKADISAVIAENK